jgi:PAS domain S-box-containing protein
LPFGTDFQAILSLIGDAVVSTDHTDRIILFNRAAEALFGYSASEALGCPLDILIPARFRDQHRGDHSRFFSDDAARHRTMAAGREVSGRRKDGTELAIEVSLSRQLIDGQQIGTAIIRDVSDRKVEEKQRQLLTDEVAHRLRNTMAVINSIVTLTARDASSAADFAKTLLGRFAAISRTNESLIRGSWIEASLRELLDSELGSGPIKGIPTVPGI